MKTDEGATPPKIRTEKLREHFSTTYRLKDDQIDMMLASTSKSLNASLRALYEALDEGGNLNEVSRLGHSVKGLLLNMGEPQWAEFARELENSAAKGESRDYRKLVECIHRGVEKIL